MELLAIIFLLWLIGAAFPGSGQSYGHGVGEILGFLACAALLVGLFVAYLYTAAGLMWIGHHFGFHDSWTIFCLLGPIVTPMLIASYFNWRAAKAVPAGE